MNTKGGFNPDKHDQIPTGFDQSALRADFSIEKSGLKQKNITESRHDTFAALKIPDIRYFIAAVGLFSISSRALAVVIGFQIYQLTHSAFALGILGLVEALPAISLVLIGGYVADHHDRRKILLITRLMSFICAVALTLLSLESHAVPLIGLYATIFIAGIARGFADPANSAFEAQVVPQHITVNGATWIGSVWISASIIGPAMIGFVYAGFGAAGSYLVISIIFLLAWLATRKITPKPVIKPKTEEPLLKSISEGWHFVMKNPPLWGAMTLDLFAVLFSGAVALLPMFAMDILKVGPIGLGFLNASPAFGALMIMLIATRHPPIEHAGRNLLWTVAGFGVSILVFAFSKHFALSIIALIFVGIFDGISMVIRRSMVRLLSPDHMRGRIASVNWIFVCSSNELGTFYGGMMAAAIGPVACVTLGGMITLGIVGFTAWIAPQLRQLRFNPKTLERTL